MLFFAFTLINSCVYAEKSVFCSRNAKDINI